MNPVTFTSPEKTFLQENKPNKNVPLITSQVRRLFKKRKLLWSKQKIQITKTTARSQMLRKFGSVKMLIRHVVLMGRQLVASRSISVPQGWLFICWGKTNLFRRASLAFGHGKWELLGHRCTGSYHWRKTLFSTTFLCCEYLLDINWQLDTSGKCCRSLFKQNGN